MARSAIQQWIATTLGVTLGYHAVHTLVHAKLRARPKVARPSHKKSPEVVTNVQTTFAERLHVLRVSVDHRFHVAGGSTAVTPP